MMKSLIAALCLAFAVSPLAIAAQSSTNAAKPERTLTPQQKRMGECSHKSKGMKGDAHKKFMHDCLTGHSTTSTAAKPTQQDKMKSCNAEAKGKKLAGDSRKKFMSECLKG